MESTKILLAKRHMLECAESIYVRTTETTCLSDELCFCKEEEDGQIVSLGDSRIERVRDRLTC